MTWHLLKLVWNRKRQNGLLAVEILLAFIVLFAVLVFAGSAFSAWQYPMGFAIDRVWKVELGYPGSGPLDDRPDVNNEARPAAVATYARVRQVLADLPNIEMSAASWPAAPYNRGGWSTGLGEEGAIQAMTAASFATDTFDDVLSMPVTAGRWFTREDDASASRAAVINERLARQLFGDEDPLNRTLPPIDRGEAQAVPVRIVGVIQDFRYEGEFDAPGNMIFLRLREDDAAGVVLPNHLTIRVTPGTTAEFEGTLVEALQAVAPDWSFEVTPLDLAREERIRSAMAPLTVGGIVALFLLLMVALGLTGVVWQSVTRRIREFGLRRAKGATAPDVQRQVLSELLLLTSLAVGLGAALLVQIPAIALWNFRADNPNMVPPDIEGLFAPAVWGGSIAISAAVIYVLTLLCGWYPSRLATRVQPAEALHYE
jgi:putative ABC transport system permease protein